MNTLDYQILNLEKRVPLTISRGTHTHSEIVWLRWREAGVEGWGEAVPFSTGVEGETVADIVDSLSAAREILRESSAWDRIRVEQTLRAARVSSALLAGVNQAMFDWLGKTLAQPVWRVLGLTPRAGPLTSATIGIGTPAAARVRVRQWHETGDVRAFKIKLGSPAGIAADRAMFEAVLEEVGAGIRLSVDANGGWSVTDACAMAAWLADRGVDHVEQPLPRGQETELPKVRGASALPVFVDESCRTSLELAALVGSVDGINIKLMKCGGLDEALRLVAVARAHGLRILVGCYGSSALGNTAAANLAPLVDYLDLDSHLNLRDDPFRGASLEAGGLSLPIAPGFGVTYE